MTYTYYSRLTCMELFLGFTYDRGMILRIRSRVILQSLITPFLSRYDNATTIEGRRSVSFIHRRFMIPTNEPSLTINSLEASGTSRSEEMNLITIRFEEVCRPYVRFLTIRYNSPSFFMNFF